MGKSLAQKKEIVSKVQARISSAQLMFSLKLEKVTMPEINSLRNSLPAGTNAIVIKNRLLKRASGNTPWAATDKLGKGSNLWVVIDDDVKGSIKAFKDWQKATKKEDGIIGGVVEGMVSVCAKKSLRLNPHWLRSKRIISRPDGALACIINKGGFVVRRCTTPRASRPSAAFPPSSSSTPRYASRPLARTHHASTRATYLHRTQAVHTACQQPPGLYTQHASSPVG
jgi:ribosomal protein L10